MATIDELYQQSLLGNLPTTLTPYQRIMGQMTPTMNPYTGAGVAIGGYDPALYRRMSGSGLINLGSGGGDSGGGGGGGGGGGDSGGLANPFGDLTQAERAGYYAENPNMASVTRGLQGLFGLTSLGSLARAMNPGLFSEEALIAMGVDPATYQNARESFRASEINAMNAGYTDGFGSPAAQGQTSSQSGEGNPGESYGGFTSSDTGVGNPGESDSGGYGGYGGTSSDTGSGNPGESGSSDSSSSDSGGGDSGGGDGYAKGGKVTKSRLKGPDPKGPDEGYGALLSGEYVIKKSAVKKYGQGLLDMINDGKIPAKKMKSLLG